MGAVPSFDPGVALLAFVLLVVWPVSVLWFRRLERRRPPMSATGDGAVHAECIHCEGVGALPGRDKPSLCPSCGGTGLADERNQR